MPKVLGIPTGVCQLCDADAFCATCRRSSTRCTSCLADYELDGNRCISVKNVGLNLVLDTTLPTFILNIRFFKLGIMDLLGGRFRNRRRLFTCRSIRQGSVIVDGSVTVPNN